MAHNEKKANRDKRRNATHDGKLAIFSYCFRPLEKGAPMFRKYILPPLAALLAVLTIAVAVRHAVDEGGDKPRTLVGTWQAQINDNATVVATISPNKIEVKWSSPDATALYWTGTFPADDVVAAGAQIESVADKDALSRSILGSMADTKTFTYVHGELQFYMTAFGVTRMISLKN